MVYALPSGFVYLDQVDPTIIQDIRYATSNNFVGHPIPGYRKNRCILTTSAAHRLKALQKKIQSKGLSLKVYDCYRPTIAVKAFMRWSRDGNRQMKAYYYPREDKNTLFAKGYIAAYSGHSRGSTVDLSLVAKNGKAKKGEAACYSSHRKQDDSLDMGSNFDCLDVSSHYHTNHISRQAKENRQQLRRFMHEVGFRPYNKEWWHFTLRNEPYPRHYFNFPVE